MRYVLDRRINHAYMQFPEKLRRSILIDPGATYLELKFSFYLIKTMLGFISLFFLLIGTFIAVFWGGSGFVFICCAMVILLGNKWITKRNTRIFVIDSALEMIYSNMKDIPFSEVDSLQIVHKLNYSQNSLDSREMYGLLLKTHDSSLNSNVFRIYTTEYDDLLLLAYYLQETLSDFLGRLIDLHPISIPEFSDEPCMMMIKNY